MGDEGWVMSFRMRFARICFIKVSIIGRQKRVRDLNY